ncbi:hypothetical protein [Paracidobacterium acidisoli]|uniref:Uncharacterized protein n=1 Tax=Paracidobacterium acidisoli TaxID=2303751 RepID=A0A372IR99_9BACT|nr:hypothetical protein [Paracidobacterium acidisoli]MBT9330317.1 hypothetical protein [Paracidobacterium acidisoli]
MNALMLVNETIEALTRVDAERLEALAEAAMHPVSPPLAGERKEVMTRSRVLARMLGYTRHNLRLAGSRHLPGDERRSAWPPFRG